MSGEQSGKSEDNLTVHVDAVYRTRQQPSQEDLAPIAMLERRECKSALSLFLYTVLQAAAAEGLATPVKSALLNNQSAFVADIIRLRWTVSLPHKQGSSPTIVQGRARYGHFIRRNKPTKAGGAIILTRPVPHRNSQNLGTARSIIPSIMSNPTRISKRKLANPIQAPQNLGYNDPVLEAEARKTRYVSLSLGELAVSGAPVQIWTTERPASTPHATEHDTFSSSESNSDASSTVSLSTTVNLSKYLAKIPISNDRAYRGKLSRVELLPHEDAYLSTKEPDTPSSLPPRNTLPKVLSPSYIPPGRRGSRAPAIVVNDRQPEAPLVQAPLPKRSHSSTSSQSITVPRRTIPLRRTASAETATVALEAVQPSSEGMTDAQPAYVSPKRGRPRKVVSSSANSPPRPMSVTTAWTSKRTVEIPLHSPSTSSNSTGNASTAEESSFDNEEAEDDFEDEEDDDNYAPPPSHRRKVSSNTPSNSVARKSVAKVAPRSSRKFSKKACVDATVDGATQIEHEERYQVSGVSTISHNSFLPIVPAGPVLGHFNKRKRHFSEMSTSDDSGYQQPEAQRVKPNRPLTLTLKRSHITRTVPRLHSPLSQSFYVSREEAASLSMPAQAYHTPSALSVL